MDLVTRIRLLTLAAFLLTGSPFTAGDSAYSLPATQSGSLRSIAEINLDDMDKQSRDSIRTARQRLNEILQTQTSATRQAGYGLWRTRWTLPGPFGLSRRSGLLP